MSKTDFQNQERNSPLRVKILGRQSGQTEIVENVLDKVIMADLIMADLIMADLIMADLIMADLKVIDLNMQSVKMINFDAAKLA